MGVLDDSMVNVELFPGEKPEPVPGEAQQQAEGTANQVQGAAKRATDGAKQQANGALNRPRALQERCRRRRKAP